MTFGGYKVLPFPDDAPRALQARLGWVRACCNFEIAARRFENVRCKYGPDQPRVPAGNPDGGQWTAGDGHSRISVRTLDGGTTSADTPGQTLSDESPAPILPGQQFAQARATITAGPGALTGISQIDEVSAKLTKTLAQTMEALDYIPKKFGSAYGNAVHAAFAASVRLQNLPGVSVEQSYDESNKVTRYGAGDSIRTNVILRNDIGDVLAIYDVKTGGARLYAPRANELRARTGASPRTPVIEIHFERGLRLKYESLEENEWPALEAHFRRAPLRGAIGCYAYG